MQVICLAQDAFCALVEEVVQRIKEKEKIKEDKWISDEEAMLKLRIKSKTTLQRLRDDGRIRFSQPTKKSILYVVDSINEYLEKHTKRNILSCGKQLLPQVLAKEFTVLKTGGINNDYKVQGVVAVSGKEWSTGRNYFKATFSQKFNN